MEGNLQFDVGTRPHERATNNFGSRNRAGPMIFFCRTAECGEFLVVAENNYLPSQNEPLLRQQSPAILQRE
jgi:hypothetical protein